MVVSEWLKAFHHRGERPELYYRRSKQGLEVDLIVDRNGRLHPIEIKATATLLPGHMESIEKFRELAGVSASEGIVAARVAEPFIFKGSRVIAWNQSLDAN